MPSLDPPAQIYDDLVKGVPPSLLLDDADALLSPVAKVTPEEDTPYIKVMLAQQPDIGAGDESKCLPGWLHTFAHYAETNQSYTISGSACRAICHTLLAQRERVKRLVRGRDALKVEDVNPVQNEKSNPVKSVKISLDMPGGTIELAPDERDLLKAMQDAESAGKDASPLVVGLSTLGMPVGRVEYLCRTWVNRGWFTHSGPSTLYGRLTTRGLGVKLH